MKNKRALSAVVMMVVMIALVVSLMAVIFSFTKDTVTDKLESASSCSEIFDKLEINEEYVCYNSTVNEVVFSLSQGDLVIDELLISVAGEITSETFHLYQNKESELTYYNGTISNVFLPGPKAGKTYVAQDINFIPINIKIAPIIDGNACDVVDSVSGIIDCSKVTF